MPSLSKDQSHEMGRFVAGGGSEEDGKADDQEHPAELGRPATVPEFVGKLRCDYHALDACQSMQLKLGP